MRPEMDVSESTRSQGHKAIPGVITIDEYSRAASEFEKMLLETIGEARNLPKYKIEVRIKQEKVKGRAKSYRHFGVAMALRSDTEYKDGMARGAGDAPMFWCLACHKPVAPEHFAQDLGVCEHCGKTGKQGRQFADARSFDTQNLREVSDLVEEMFVKLQMDADIFLIQYHHSMTKARRIHDEEGKTSVAHVNQIRRARSRREPVVFTRDGLLKATHTGQSISDAVLGLLKA